MVSYLTTDKIKEYLVSKKGIEQESKSSVVLIVDDKTFRFSNPHIYIKSGRSKKGFENTLSTFLQKSGLEIPHKIIERLVQGTEIKLEIPLSYNAWVGVSRRIKNKGDIDEFLGMAERYYEIVCSERYDELIQKYEEKLKKSKDKLLEETVGKLLS